MSDEVQRLFDALGEAQPAYCTRPTRGAPNDLAKVRIVAEALGKPLIPWQALAARIITERRIDDPARYRWPVVVLTTPRQVGKTTTYGAIQTTKCIMQRGREAFYTAQTGKDARARWKDLVELLSSDVSPFRDDIKIRMSAGDPQIKFSNGSTISPFAPTPESLHGYTPHDVAVDEGFAFDLMQGRELEGAIGPAQQNIKDRQRIIFSTAGNKDSTWLQEQIEQGRELADDPGAGVAFIEWSMPQGADMWHPDTWKFHPGLGHLFSLEDMHQLAEEHKNKPETWLRAFMNTWSDEADIPPILTLEEVAAVQTEQTPPKHGLSDVALAYEVALDRSRACIAAAWYDPKTGRPAVRIAELVPEPQDLPYKIEALRQARPRHIGADDGGPTRDTTDMLRKQGHEPDVLSARDFATATEAFTARVKDKLISLESNPYLEQAIADAVTKPMGQGIILDRRQSRGPIPELIAAVVALRLLENAPAPAPSPEIRF